MRSLRLAALALLGSTALAAAPAAHVLVFCSPGSPGTTAEAQPTMDAFAAALGAKAGLPRLAAVYGQTEDAGVERLRAKDAAAAVLSVPFYLEHEKALGLDARLLAVPKGREATERWSLVANKGRVASPAALGGLTIASSAGFAPGFVRGPGVGEWGPLPATVKVTQSSAVLSALRKAAAGEDVAVLLDGAQAAALASLPFAADLEVVARSAPLPVGVVAAVGNRLPSRSWRELDAALRSMHSDPKGAAALDAVRVARFEPLDGRALVAARKAYAASAR
jgi:hypothetical protein